MEKKRCSCCGRDRDLDFFSNDSKSSDGKQSWCKPCKSGGLNIYYQENPSKRRGRSRLAGRERYNREKVNQNMSRQIRRTLQKVGGKRYSWEALVGYSLSDLKKHLESKFKPGMSWSNYGRWHIDHRTPISKFKITSANCDEFKKCWAISNLQPLWARENLSKGNKIAA